MMLSRTGWGETPLPVAFQTVEGRRAPWGCAAEAPCQGAASPPPPPLTVQDLPLSLFVSLMLVCCKPVLRYSWFAIGTVM